MEDKLKTAIAGEIVLSRSPGKTMKKWREIFKITQSELSGNLHIVPSTISDYESNRRASPGTAVIKRFVDAIVEIDLSKGGKVVSQLTQSMEKEEEYFTLHEFATSINAIDFIKLIKGKVVANEELVESKKIYGYTLIKSLKVIMDLPSSQFMRLYGAMGERAFIFSDVSTGRSPMVAIRVASLKPSLVIFQKLKEVDPIAIKIAEKEQIPIVITDMGPIKLQEELNRI
ncbi:transcriptional regulator [Candidatus Micrarchaeota archaeon]|nr:transcriptional regulator [Candidatus Micrarchaeota archaeon]